MGNSSRVTMSLNQRQQEGYFQKVCKFRYMLDIFHAFFNGLKHNILEFPK